MAEASPPAPPSPLDVELDPEFEPQSRPRSCTWPLQRPELQGSPSKPAGEAAADAASMIPEEDDDDEDGGGSAMAIGGAGPSGGDAALVPDEAARLLVPGPAGAGLGAGPGAGAAATASSAPRKCSSRRNAWGNLSYADLITRAIESAPDKRLTLSQIYDWMVRCVPYFKDKGDSNSSAGWKVGAGHPTREGLGWAGLGAAAAAAEGRPPRPLRDERGEGGGGHLLPSAAGEFLQTETFLPPTASLDSCLAFPTC